MMHVIFRDGLEDHDYLERYAVGDEELRERAREWTPERGGDDRPRAEEIEAFAREYATTQPSPIRLNYGLKRHAGGGMAVRTIACLPAVVGAWRDVGGGRAALDHGHLPVGPARLERPDLVRPGTRTVNMTSSGAPDRATLGPPVQALYVYNSNPAAVAPDQDAGAARPARDDLFTVVHEQFQTDTADFADILLPATTPLEHFDIHRPTATSTSGSTGPRSRRSARRCRTPRSSAASPPAWASSTEPARADEADGAAAFKWAHPSGRHHVRAAAARGLGAPERAGSLRRLRRGRLPDPVGQVRAVSEKLGAEGHRPAADYIPPREGPRATPSWPAFPLAFISPPAHHFLNSTFSAQPVFVRREGEPRLVIHPDDAAARRIHDGQMVRAFNDRGAFLAKARVSDAARLGVVVGLSVWWAKLCPGGRNANAVTSQALTDLGGGATFYDALVEVEPA